jgi:hypothetical protein
MPFGFTFGGDASRRRAQQVQIRLTKMSQLIAWLGNQGWKFFLFGAIFLVFALLVREMVKAFVLPYSLPMLALLGVVTLLGALLIFTALLDVIGLSDKTQALGLPEGSVRALLALALLGLFAIVASYILVPKTELRTATGLSSDDVAALIRNNPDARDIVQTPEKEAKYKVTFYSPVRPDDFAKQMLTLVGTLMTAVIAFYFGTSSMRTVGDISRAAPELSGVEPETKLPTADPVTLKLRGNNLNSIRTVRLTEPTKLVELEAHTVLSNLSQITCTFAAHPALNTDGVWDVTVVDDIGRTATKKGGLPVKAATAESSPGSPVPKGISPVTAPKDIAKEYTITGSGLDVVTGVEAVSTPGGTVESARIMSKTSTEIKCELKLSVGDWTVRIASGASRVVVGPIKITDT